MAFSSSGGSADPSIADVMMSDSSHPNPMFDFLTGFVPRRLKDLFRWGEYLYYNSPQIYAALQKFGQYPITELVYNTDKPSLRKNVQRLLEKTLRIKSVLGAISTDKYVYGNAFVSVYQPFLRFLQCPRCKAKTNINHVDYKFKLKDLSFHYHCSSCKQTVEGKVLDKKQKSRHRLNIIRWDPKLMDIDYNPMTGHSEYYWTIPSDFKERVKGGNKHLINTTPMEVLRAIQKEKIFKFAEGQILHIKVEAPAGLDPQWGYPPLTACIKLFFYAAVLRKANEAIALEHVVPFRIVSPAQSSQNGDPAFQLSLGNWRQEMQDNIKSWRKDPLHIMFSPIPATVTNVGGDGRALLTLGEVQEAERNIIAALGIPQEFLYGGLTKAGMDATMHLLENQLQSHVDDLNEALQWLCDKVTDAMSIDTLDVELTEFRMTEDTERKQMVMGIHQMGMVSNDTLATMLNVDITKERDKRKQEALDETRFNHELQVETQKLQKELMEQQQLTQASGQGLTYDQQAIIAQADMIVEQFMGMDVGTRRSQFDALQKEDYVMYSVVKGRWEDMYTQQAAMQRSEMNGQMQQDMGGMPV